MKKGFTPLEKATHFNPTGIGFPIPIKERSNRRLSLTGFTLVEMLTVLAVIGIGMGLFYSVFYLNWSSFEKQLALIDLGQEANRIIETISFDGRIISDIDVAEDSKTVNLTSRDLDGNILSSITYVITGQGQICRDGQILSENIEFDNSSFTKVGNSLVVELLLTDDVFGQGVQLPVKTQIFARNIRDTT